MTETPSAHKANLELVEDHRRLQLLIDRLQAAAAVPELAAALAELHAALTRHFNEEERPGGLYDALGVCAAEFRARLAVLVDEHFRLAGVLRDLAERARDSSAPALSGLRRDASHVAAALADHERREQDLVKSAGG